jgi:hypothetical protein
VGSATGVKS